RRERERPIKGPMAAASVTMLEGLLQAALYRTGVQGKLQARRRVFQKRPAVISPFQLWKIYSRDRLATRRPKGLEAVQECEDNNTRYRELKADSKARLLRTQIQEKPGNAFPGTAQNWRHPDRSSHHMLASAARLAVEA